MGRANPLISVIMPVFNTGHFLRQAIESILSQTYKNFELLIINDGSTDNSLEIIESYKDTRIRLISQVNSGISHTLNTGIQLAKGSFIARMDGDDISNSNRLQEQLEYLQKHPESDLVFSQVRLINEAGQVVGTWAEDIHHTSPQAIHHYLTTNNCLAHPTLFARRSLFDDFRYRENQIYGEDYDLWLQILSGGHQIHKLSKALLLYRIHTDSYTQVNNRKIDSIKKVSIVKRTFLLDQLASKRFGRTELRVLKSLLLHYRQGAREFFRGYLQRGGRKKTVIIARNAYSFGGAEKSVALLARHLKSSGYHPIIITNVAELSSIADSQGIRSTKLLWLQDSTRTDHLYFRYLFGGSIIFLSYLYLIIRYRPHALLLESKDDQLFGTLAGKLALRRVIWLDHGGMSRDWFPSAFRVMDLLYLLAGSITNTIVTVCEDNKRLIAEHFTEKLPISSKVIVIYNGVDTDEFKTKKRVSEVRRIGFVGRLVKDKGIRHFVEAANNLAASNPELAFSIVGEGPELKWCKDFVNRHSLNVTFYPFSRNVAETLKSLDAFVMPTYAESHSFALLEAMSSGLITMATNVGGTPEVIIDEENGLLIPGSPTKQAVTDTIIRAVSLNKESVEAMSKNARSTIVKRFQISESLEKLESVING